MNGGIKKPETKNLGQAFTCLLLVLIGAIILICGTAILITWIIYG